METTRKTQGTIVFSGYDADLQIGIDAFFIDRRAQGVSQGTITFYQKKLKRFITFCESRAVKQIPELTANDIRLYLLQLQEEGHNPGGVHAHYRALRAFLLWYEDEFEPESWKNPIRKVKAPKMPIEPLEPVELATVKQILSICEHGSLVGERDRAILLALLDTGARAGELLNMNLEDLNYATGEIIIRRGKGKKPRVVFLGKKSRRALRAYLKTRRDEEPALWVTKFGTRLSYDGLRAVITHRAKLAGGERPQLHDFRRAFALNFLRNNPGGIFALQRLMGHADLQVLRRYLAQTEQDLLEAHKRGSPVDKM